MYLTINVNLPYSLSETVEYVALCGVVLGTWLSLIIRVGAVVGQQNGRHAA